ncbi:hypothetical protein ACJIZ3_020606 [Penstemon smallii]|uniref:Uncharacterized protein n=1 Tax=Penstemon smallii TaxID=265156 RepID=A0ABD3SJA6_9LAMI
MATGAAGDGFLRGVFEGCLSGGDMGIQRRPYHKNCKCALHDSRAHCTRHSRHNNVSYPIRRAWSESSLALMANAPPSGHSSPSCADSPAAQITRTQTQLVLCREDEDDGDDELLGVSFSISKV